MTLIQQIAFVVFWSCLALILFAYVGYPVVIRALSRVVKDRVPPPEPPPDELPRICLLIAAYNEEAEIEARIRNALEMDYPADKYEIVVGSDGSTDATAEIVRRFAHRGVRLLDFRQRRGKASVLNSAVAEVNCEIILFSDANTLNHPQAARKLIRWFRDPRVGAVCGRLVLTDPVTGRNADSLYWKYETFLKKCEGRIGGLLGANGAIYALRRDLYAPIPAETIVDDFVIPLLAKIRTDCSIIYDCEAVAFEETATNVRDEFHRRARIGAGGFQSIGMLWRLLDPRRGWVAFSFFSHKILRWLCPFFMIGLFLSNLALLSGLRPFYSFALLAQIGFYALSLAMTCLPAGVRALKPLRLTTMFTSMNAALLVGFWRWLWGTQRGAWKRTARISETSENLS